ncbi:hypothetical protein FGO68_gene12297 [Halteria grandinella]|uniref:SWIM-type domain-containing protein n=1 Tax=Halteria grandinella TaxID=5974 RepID=A0A8J8NV35_HALGN|nr:hypothetical protein FGO68_gene12297 [Halteria grandinella]
MAFIQTAEMLELYKRNHPAGVFLILIDSKENPNKYNMHQLLITGIDLDIGNILTYGIGFMSLKTKYQLNWILTKFNSLIQAMTNIKLKTVVCDLDKTIIKCALSVFTQAQMIVSHGSILCTFQSICAVNGVKHEIYAQAQDCLQDALLSDSKTLTREYLSILKHLLTPYPKCLTYLDQCLLAFKKLWKPFLFREQFTGGQHCYFRYSTIKKYFEEHMEDMQKDNIDRGGPKPESKGIKEILMQVGDLEKINESFYFKYKENEVMHLTQQALYFSIKKAFTPFAVLYMLKQMQISDQKKKEVLLIEKKPFIHYVIKHPLTVNNNDITVKYTLTASNSGDSAGLRRLSCSCAFSHNYRMPCWHQLLLLSRLQIKHVTAFEHLKHWRELVGVKNKERKNEGKDTIEAYGVKKERRLKSFIEAISKRNNERVKKLAKEKGITLGKRKAGDERDHGEEDQYTKLCEEARKRAVKERNLGKAREAKEKRKKEIKDSKKKKHKHKK